MRVWDVEPGRLCRAHLLGEHNEIHAIWSIINNGLKGFSAHPEVKRWRGKLAALYDRHERDVEEMKRRGYRHGSPLDRGLAVGSHVQDVMLQPVEEQCRILRDRGCCKL